MKKAIILLTIVATIIACTHTVETPAGSGTGTGGTGGGTGGGGTGGGSGGGTGSNMVCFEAEVLPIFKSSCAKSGCHDVASNQDGYTLDSYSNIMKKGIKAFDANDSKIYKAIIETDLSKRMPRPPNPALTIAQIDIIKRWINEGAQNTTNCVSTCDTTIFTFSQGVKTILDANCIGCHNGGTPSAGINLTVYSGVNSVAQNGKLLGAINHAPGFKPMPMGSSKLSDCKITQIRKWVQAGALNN